MKEIKIVKEYQDYRYIEAVKKRIAAKQPNRQNKRRSLPTIPPRS